LVPAPDQLGAAPAVPGDAIPSTPAAPPDFPAGEAEAVRRLHGFVSQAAAPIAGYATDRDRVDADGTSRLSPYLRFGMVSARHAAVEALEALSAARTPAARRGIEVWLNELVWREFFNAVLYHVPRVLRGAFRREMARVAWDDDPAAFAAWCEARTGYPIVDAAMRQLTGTGWMHNRARMIAASFLVKDLLVDWRRGERFFMRHLVDGDPAANNGGWQWVAGVGTDAAPYFRVFNPVLQGKRFDPDGAYVRRWLPALARVPAAYVHEPWRMDPAAQRAAGCVIGRDYPAPIVDHAFARARALSRYAAARG
jgi:deoxyribodipyrimidine photo-lyase